MNHVYLCDAFEETKIEKKVSWVCKVDELLYIGKRDNIFVYYGFKLQNTFPSVYLYHSCDEDKDTTEPCYNVLYSPSAQCLYMFYIINREVILYITTLRAEVISVVTLPANNTYIGFSYIYGEYIYLQSRQFLIIDLAGNILKEYNMLYFNCIAYNNLLYVYDRFALHTYTLIGDEYTYVTDCNIYCFTIHNGLLYYGSTERRLYKIEQGRILEINCEKIRKESGLQLSVSHLLSWGENLVMVLSNWIFIIFDKEYKIRKKVEIKNGDEYIVKIFEYHGNLYIATSKQFYIYGEYYPHLRERLPPTKKLKTHNWMKLLGLEPTIQKDIHFLFERELLK